MLCYRQLVRRNTKQGIEFQHLERTRWRRGLSVGEIQRLENLRTILERQICKEADVICRTSESAGRKSLGDLLFPTVIMDEVTHPVELSALIPLIHSATKVIGPCCCTADPSVKEIWTKHI
jgi:superfamily I DNA and/or RNA helicase